VENRILDGNKKEGSCRGELIVHLNAEGVERRL